MMCRTVTRSIWALFVGGLLSAQAQAALTISINAGPTPYFSVPNVIDFSPNGFSMAGMRVTATFSDNSSETAIWASTDAISGQAAGTNWLLKESGDTFTEHWELQNNQPFNAMTNTSLSMTRLVIEGGQYGNTLFDAQGNGDEATAIMPGVQPSANNGATGTVGSQLGGTFNLFTTHSFDVSVTYRNAVKLDSASSPVGDLFTTLDVEFLGSGLPGLNFFNQGGLLQFDADTDLWGAQQADVIPEPSSLLMFVGFGLAGLWQHRRKRKHA